VPGGAVVGTIVGSSLGGGLGRVGLIDSGEVDTLLYHVKPLRRVIAARAADAGAGAAGRRSGADRRRGSGGVLFTGLLLVVSMLALAAVTVMRAEGEHVPLLVGLTLPLVLSGLAFATVGALLLAPSGRAAFRGPSE